MRNMGTIEKERDGIPHVITVTRLAASEIIDDGDSISSSQAESTPSSSTQYSSNDVSILCVSPSVAIVKVIRSWASKTFMSGCVILFPIAITFYLTWWFIRFVDGFFSPIFNLLGINTFGLGFVTSIGFIFFVGVFMSSWVGSSLLTLGEVLIQKMPFISYVYTASKQISTAISPGEEGSHAFKQVAIISHPGVGGYALGFITSNVILRKNTGMEELCCVYVPTNHLYLGDIFLVNSKDVLKPNISVREGIEIVISGGMSIPQVLTTMDSQTSLATKSGKFVDPQV